MRVLADFVGLTAFLLSLALLVGSWPAKPPI